MLNDPFNEIQRLRFALDHVSAYVYIKDRESRYLYANQMTLELFGCSEESLIGRGDDDFFPPDTVNRLREVDLRVLGGEKTQEEIVVSDANGNKRVYWEVKSPIYEDVACQVAIGLLGISTDITERKRLEEQLQKAALYDVLTGLPNRRLLLDRLEQAILDSKRLNRHGAILFIDLDNFKHLNDTHGHEAGDQFLIEVAHRLRVLVREIDTIARLGGDEFIVLLEQLNSDAVQALNESEKIAEKVRMSLSREYSLNNIKYSGSASLGISLFIADRRSVEQILGEADARMYDEKHDKYR